MQFIKVQDYHTLLNIDPKLIEASIIDYISYLRYQKKLAPASISTYIPPISHFFDMNDITLNSKKINAFKPECCRVVDDQPYTREQIKIMLDKVHQRGRALILLIASSGLRIGAISDLKVGNLTTPIQKYSNNIYQITVYRKSKSNKYIIFCTPECRKEIDAYLQYRERYGERGGISGQQKQ